jgi:hypothetical protein
MEGTQVVPAQLMSFCGVPKDDTVSRNIVRLHADTAGTPDVDQWTKRDIGKPRGVRITDTRLRRGLPERRTTHLRLRLRHRRYHRILIPTAQ